MVWFIVIMIEAWWYTDMVLEKELRILFLDWQVAERKVSY